MEMPWDIDFEVYKNEEELLTGLRRNEQWACTCLLKRFARRFFLLARRMVGNDDEADEIVQESFIQACGHISRFEGKSALSTWLYRIVSNATLMQRRRKALTTLPLVEEVDEEQVSRAIDLIDEDSTPDNYVLQTELRATINRALVLLPATLRDAFVLRHIEGLSTRAAAESLGIEESALKVRVYRARQELRKILASYQ
ncbi:RNA polymerase subunit sigma-24 [Reticulibacter mediterranei]|uniref:RNA polymerase subunit sigma-24 n=1 Tax=Reticulibacter mediterranei TaxID=2778369 RepID=A0A8J3N233_9CHLR|nr:sigma-70 family RNA polymerase sigma factor [Reticulibacter mediterranei]GHO93128.1 RNA polymerase subunit sigma-24 [Reticulibacter mediterranei]